MKALLGILTIFFFVDSWAQEALPVAPKRSDDRDELSYEAFASMTGQDPTLPSPATTTAQRQPAPPATRSVTAVPKKGTKLSVKKGIPKKAVAQTKKPKDTRKPANFKKLPPKKKAK